MPTIITTDIIDTLNHLASLLLAAPDPRPLTAYDAHDLRRAAVVIRKLREREGELEREVARLEGLTGGKGA